MPVATKKQNTPADDQAAATTDEAATIAEEPTTDKPKRSRKRKTKTAKKAEEASDGATVDDQPADTPPTKKAKAKKPRPKSIKPAVKDDPSGGREPLYTEVEAMVYEGEHCLTEEMAKDLLGWTTGTEEQPLEKDKIHFVDMNKTPVHCANVAKHQRKFYERTYTTIMSDILNGHWQFNGQVFSAGRHGWLIDGKHRLTALVMACQAYRQNPQKYPEWQTEPALPIVGIFGIAESQKVVQTIDTGKPRTLADTVYSSGFFDGFDQRQLPKLCRIAEGAIRLVSDRTRALVDSYNPILSHTEAMDLVDRHPTILSAVRTVFDENTPIEDGKGLTLSSIIPPGAMAGLLYLMMSDGDAEKYHNADYLMERNAEMTRIDKAEEFLVLLASSHKSVNAIQKVIVEHTETGYCSMETKCGIVVKGFNEWLAKGKVTPAKCRLEMKHDETTGKYHQLEFPIIDGGIDRGPDMF